MESFDIIAPIYGRFFNYQVKYFKKIIQQGKKEVDFKNYENLLDIGCGTGAFCKVIQEKGLDVTGVDTSQGMLNQAKKKLENTPVKLYKITPGERLPFPNKSFDIVHISYVVHGLKKEERIYLYREMKRLAKYKVILHDYNEKRAWYITLVEWLENGDYFNFIKIAQEEMEGVFDRINKIPIDKRAAWYIWEAPS